jgi:hypothetical protein
MKTKGMTDAVRRLVVARKSDAAIVDALKPKYPPLTARIVREVRDRTKKVKVRVVKKLPAPAAAPAQQRRSA